VADTGGRLRRQGLAAVGVALTGMVLVACGTTGSVSSSGVIRAVAAENEYANVLSQIGGRYVSVSSILQNPNTDPHAFEASTSVAKDLASAQIVVQNGLGYDTFMNKIEAATSNPKRKIIVAQSVLRLPDSTPNPHLWYKPYTMYFVARTMAQDLSSLDPKHATYFSKRLAKFDASIIEWIKTLDAFQTTYRGTPVAVTEPVADYLLSALGLRIVTPFIFQADIMNGIDPSPEDIALENSFFTKHEVRLFCYNEQVVDSLTSSLRANASLHQIPIVGVYETMPTPGFTYQSWMVAEVKAITQAIATGQSTGILK
jgi:zinc/manganese transport system substrate-binding protein